MTRTISANSNPERWGACGILLSLDCVETLIGPMGLRLDPPQLKDAVREAVIASRANFEKGNTEPVFSTLLLHSLRSRFAKDAVAHFESWFASDFTLDVHDHKPWRTWYLALSGFAHDSISWSHLGLSAASSARLYNQYDSIMSQADIWGLWKEARVHPLSEWDLEMYAIHEFHDDTKDPFDLVVLTYETHCFRQFWSEFKLTLADSDLNALWLRLKNDPELTEGSFMRLLPEPSTLNDEDAA